MIALAFAIMLAFAFLVVALVFAGASDDRLPLGLVLLIMGTLGIQYCAMDTLR